MSPLRDSIPTPPPDSSGALGLLTYLGQHALDDDYEHVARSRPSATTRPHNWWLVFVPTAVFALLVATAAAQTADNANTDASERASLVRQIKDRQASLDDDRGRVAALTREVATLRTGLLSNTALSSGTRSRLTTLSAYVGSTDVTGAGVVVEVDDAPNPTSDEQTVLDTDLQRLANGLWLSGAEAISINGQRLTNLSSIRQAGEAITIGFRAIVRPYRIEAIGDPATLPTRFAATANGQAWLDLQQQLGLRFSIRAEQSLTLPAARTTELRHAKVLEARP